VLDAEVWEKLAENVELSVAKLKSLGFKGGLLEMTHKCLPMDACCLVAVFRFDLTVGR